MRCLPAQKCDVGLGTPEGLGIGKLRDARVAAMCALQRSGIPSGDSNGYINVSATRVRPTIPTPRRITYAR